MVGKQKNPRGLNIVSTTMSWPGISTTDCTGIATEAGVLIKKSFLAGSNQLPKWVMHPLPHQRQKVTIFTKTALLFSIEIEVTRMCLCTPVPKPATEKVAPFLLLAISRSGKQAWVSQKILESQKDSSVYASRGIRPLHGCLLQSRRLN